MKIDLQTVVCRLRESDDILLLTHRNPDGDAAGSLWALYRLLTKLGKRVTFKLVGKVPENLLFAAEAAPEEFEEKFIVAVDLAETTLLGEALQPVYGDKIDLNIDHHGSNTLFAKETWLEADAAAAAQLVYQLYLVFGAELDVRAAEQLYIGLSTDTGCFRYSNTNAACLYTAAALVEAGIDNGDINRRIFETKSKAYIQFEALAMNNLHLHFDGKCAVMALTKEMFLKTGLDESETHMIAGLPRQVEGVLVGATIKEKDNGLCRVSLRSNEPVDVSAIARAFGGGGHKLAAGCDLYGTLGKATADLLKEIEAALRSYHLL
ncbi:MAG: bifunctional oligoribonuclease/PAP phosphatase NrnA [Ruminococcaceae bacterium]|nr:bifunctional oligoribonuclease/PAP phosphatase NrnA [Oscillospiraceae bacterium]